MQNLTFENVFDRIKERHDMKSDYAVCKAFGLSPQNVSGWRKGRSHPDEKMCQILADAAGIDPLVLTAFMQSQRSKTEEARSMWAMIAERLQMASPGIAAALFSVAIATSFVATDAAAAPVNERTDLAHIDSTSYTLYLVVILA